MPAQSIAFHLPAHWAHALDRALPQLDLLAAAGKDLVVRALTRAISVHGVVNVAEADLLRTVCAVRHCALPPLPSQSREPRPC